MLALPAINEGDDGTPLAEGRSILHPPEQGDHVRRRQIVSSDRIMAPPKVCHFPFIL
jgi:hypothetical protein